MEKKNERRRASCSDFYYRVLESDAYRSEFCSHLPRNITSPLSVCTVQKERKKTKKEVALRGDPNVANKRVIADKEI